MLCYSQFVLFFSLFNNDLEDIRDSSSNIDFNSIYPVGSIYMSTNSTNPNTLFGGTWQQIQGRFLLAAGGGYSAGATGGEATHKLTVSEMPSHSHTVSSHWTTLHAGSGTARYSDSGSATLTTSSAGGNAAHNNMPPYLVVYIWKRTA